MYYIISISTPIILSVSVLFVIILSISDDLKTNLARELKFLEFDTSKTKSCRIRQIIWIGERSILYRCISSGSYGILHNIENLEIRTLQDISISRYYNDGDKSESLKAEEAIIETAINMLEQGYRLDEINSAIVSLAISSLENYKK